MERDAADLHVERWRDHWVLESDFDDAVEALTYRIGVIRRYLRTTTRAALATVGLQDFEYDTLHSLMIRETPGRASPGALATDLAVSNAGMTGRLDGLEKKGWVKRVPGEGDRRRVDVEITRAGMRIWNQAMDLRGHAEDEAAHALTAKELSTLNRLLKKITLNIEHTHEEKS